MKFIKEYFTEIFTLLAWVTLLGFVFWCAVTGNKTDSIRDAWNILILISGFVWGSQHQKKNSNTPGETTAEINASITTQNNNANEPNT